MSDSDHHHYFQMVDGGMACACGEKITAEADLPAFLRAADLAMELEGVGPATRERVRNRLIYGCPEGQRVHVHVTLPGDAGAVAIGHHRAMAMRAMGFEP